MVGRQCLVASRAGGGTWQTSCSWRATVSPRLRPSSPDSLRVSPPLRLWPPPSANLHLVPFLPDEPLEGAAIFSLSNQAGITPGYC